MEEGVDWSGGKDCVHYIGISFNSMHKNGTQLFDLRWGSHPQMLDYNAYCTHILVLDLLKETGGSTMLKCIV